MPSLVVGCPVWDRGWCLDTWFDAVQSNCDPRDTGLVFVVPTTDHHTREVIRRRCGPFAFCEVLRDRNEQYDRVDRRGDNHTSLALSRNAILKHVQDVRPDFYCSWDSDLLIGPLLLPKLREYEKPVLTVWTWLNRTEPKRHRHFHQGRVIPVEYEDAMQATAMEWIDTPTPSWIAQHLDGARWDEYASGLWRCDVALAFQLMTPQVYGRVQYAPHPHGEDIPFNWALEEAGIERWCYGEHPGVHLFDREQSGGEVKLGYPQIMTLAEQKPLAALRKRPEDPELAAIGLWPLQSA